MENLENLEQQTSATGEEQVNNDANPYISTIREMNKNSVSRESYERIEQKLAASEKNNAELLKIIAEGSSVKMSSATEEMMNDEDYVNLRNRVSAGDGLVLSTPERISDIMKYREEYFKRYGEDVFTSPFANDYDDSADAEELATFFRHCLEYSEGDDKACRNEMDRLMQDLPQLKTKKRSR